MVRHRISWLFEGPLALTFASHFQDRPPKHLRLLGRVTGESASPKEREAYQEAWELADILDPK